MGEEVVPERMQEQANPQTLFELIDRYITDEKYAQQVIEKLRQLPHRLGEKGATARVARSIENYL